MPRGVRKPLSKEELEIHEVLSPNKGSSRQASEVSNIVIRTNTGNPSNLNRPKTSVERKPNVERSNVTFERPIVNLDRSSGYVERPQAHVYRPRVQDESSPVDSNQSASSVPRFAVSELFSIIKDSVVAGVKEGFTLHMPQMQGSSQMPQMQGSSQKRKRPVAEASKVYINENDVIDDDLPEVGLDAVLEETASRGEIYEYDNNASRGEIFGENVNDSDYEYEGDEDHDDYYGPDRADTGRNPPQVQYAGETVSPSLSAPPSTPADEPDPDLPTIDKRLPVNWSPSVKIMSFVKKAADDEWSKEKRQLLVERFNAKEEYDEFLLPVKLPRKLYRALKSPVTKKRDYLLSRLEIERQLFNANFDLCVALRPIMEVFDLVSAMPQNAVTKNIKNLIGYSIMAICSANLKISRGRREVARRFVRLDWAEDLYSKKPSHACIFGGTSLDDAVKAARESSKTDDSLVYAPKRKRPFRPSFAYYKDLRFPSQTQGRGGPNMGFRHPQTRQQYNDYNNNNYQYGSKSRGQYQRYRGKGRGGKRGAKSTRAAYSQN